MVGWFLLVFVFESSDGIQHLISGFTDGDTSHVPTISRRVNTSCERVDLGHCEPGQGGEHEVEQVLTNVNHDVLVLEDALLDGLAEIKKTMSFCYKDHPKSLDNTGCP